MATSEKQKERCRKYAKWLRRHRPDTAKSYQLRYKYGITIEEYKAISRLQNHRCKICGKKEKKRHSQTGKLRDLCVDHDHKTGKIRGLLCDVCNRLLALARDNKIILSSAIDYLEVNRGNSA